MSTYFNRDDELEDYLRRYNDEFPMRADLERELDAVLEFIDAMRFPPTSRLWKKADLFSAMIELHAALYKRQKSIRPDRVASALANLYSSVDDEDLRREPESDPARYYKAALQATNDRSSRITRGEILRRLLDAVAADNA